jgi:hypothetical protein
VTKVPPDSVYPKFFRPGPQNPSLGERYLSPPRTHFDPPDGLVQILANRAESMLD